MRLPRRLDRRALSVSQPGADRPQPYAHTHYRILTVRDGSERLLVVAEPQGYGRSPNVTAWGGSIIRVTNSSSSESGTSGAAAYHLFATEEVFGCGMASWKSNSQVIHAVSSSPSGPFVRESVAVPHATNPCVIWDKSVKRFRTYSGEYYV